MKLKFLSLTIFLVLFSNAFSKEIERKSCVIKYDFSSKGFTKKILFTCIIPHSINDVQKVTNIEFSKKPVKVFTKNGCRYAQFRFDSISRAQKLVIKAQLQIYRYDFFTKKNSESKPTQQNINLNNYLIEERYIETNDPLIRTVAYKLRSDDTLKTIMNIHKFIHNNIKYDIQTNKPLGATQALKLKKGDCTEFSDLFVTLCRANNIPSRVIKGMVTKYKKNPYHAWAEVYLQQYGWIRVEPTTPNYKSFAHLDNKYIQLSSIRNNKQLKNFSFNYYTYWGDAVRLRSKTKIK